MFAIDTNVASELMRQEPMPAVAAWIAGRDAEEIYLTAGERSGMALRHCDHAGWQAKE